MKTKCCYTKHYALKEDSSLCTNSQCTNYLSVTSLVKQNRAKRFITSGWLFLFLVVFTSTDFSNVNPDTVNIKLLANLRHVCRPLTREALMNELNEAEVVCPDEAFAQIMLESGNLSSFLLKHTNNMLGMRYPFRRETTAKGLYLPSKDTIIYGSSATLKQYASQNNYAVYSCWKDAVQDYKLWQEKYFHITESYLRFLGNVYAEDSSYESKIRTVMAKSK